MATTYDRSTPQQVQVHTTTTQRYDGTIPPYRLEGGVGKNIFSSDRSGGFFSFDGAAGGLSTTQILAIIVGIPIGGTLLLLAGLSLVGTLIGLAIATPVFILFSPVLVPAAFTIGLAVAGILTAGTCGLTGLVSFSWLINYIRQTHGTVPEQLDSMKHRVADMAEYVGQKTKETGQEIQTKAQDAKRST